MRSYANRDHMMTTRSHNVPDPVEDQDVATKLWVLAQMENLVPIAVSTITPNTVSTAPPQASYNISGENFVTWQIDFATLIHTDGSRTDCISATLYPGNGILAATFPAALADGTYLVEVSSTTTGTVGVSTTELLTVGAPVVAVTQISPPTTVNGAALTLMVMGTGFTDATAVEVGGIPATSITPLSDAQMMGNFDAGVLILAPTAYAVGVRKDGTLYNSTAPLLTVTALRVDTRPGDTPEPKAGDIAGPK